MFKFTAYLCNQEVDIFLDKDIDLFHEDGLDLLLGLAAEVCRGLRDSTCHQSVTLIGHLSGQVTSCFVYLASLWMKGNIFLKPLINQFNFHVLSPFKPLCMLDESSEQLHMKTNSR